MRDFMDFLQETAQEELEARRLDEFPQLVARAQAQNRAAVVSDPMLMAGLVQQRPLQSQTAAIPQEEREKKTEPMWLGFLWGFLLGAATVALVLIRVLV